MPLLQKSLSKIARPGWFPDGRWPFPPRIIYLIVNNACNAFCTICDIGLRNKESVFYQNFIPTDSGSMPLEVLEKLVSELGSFRPKIRINGVEPLLYNQIIPALELLKRHHLPVQIITNGILLEKHAEDLVSLGLDTLRVSLDGTADLHNRIRGNGVFEKAMVGIEKVVAYRRKAGGAKPKIIINCTICDINQEHLADFADKILAVDGIDAIQFKHLYFITPEMSGCHNEKFSYLGLATPTNIVGIDLNAINSEIIWPQYQTLVRDSRISFWPDLSKQEYIEAYYRRPSEFVKSKRCHTPWTSAHIQPNGTAIIRSRCFPYTVGNVLETPFMEIWNGERFRQFRRELLRNRGAFPVCPRCCGMY